MSEEPTQFQPTYALDAADAERPLSWMNLRKLLVLLVFMAAVPLMVVELLSSQREQDVELRRARESIDALADAIAVSNARMVEGVDQFLQALAASPVIAGNDLQACARYLQRILTLQPAYLNFGVIGPDGRLLCEATGNPASFNLGDRGYFQRALEGGGLAVGDYQVGRVTGRPSIAFARPVVTENGVAKGVVYAALDLQALSDNLRAGRAMPGAAVLLVDASGIVLASSDGSGVQSGLPLADNVLRLAVARRQVGVVVEDEGTGPAVLRALRPVKAGVGRDLYVAVAVPAQTVIAPSLHRLHLRLAGILAIALGVAAAVWVGGYRLVLRPVEQLISGLRHVEAGDYVQALNRTSSPLRELDELQRSLGSLAMALDAQRFERDQALAALSEREARYRELFKANPQVMFVYEIRSLRFLAVNEAALAFYGYSREEMLDMALPDVEPPGIQAPPQPSPGGAATEGRLAASGPRRHQNKNGDIRLVERIASPTVFEGWPAELMMVTDVTDRLATEARVREGAERLEQRVAERTRELQLSIRELEAFLLFGVARPAQPLGCRGHVRTDAGRPPGRQRGRAGAAVPGPYRTGRAGYGEPHRRLADAGPGGAGPARHGPGGPDGVVPRGDRRLAPGRSAAQGRRVTGGRLAVHGRCRLAAPDVGQPAGQCLEIHIPHAAGPDPDRARAGGHRPGGSLFRAGQRRGV
jgi:PAS domain S-box-containing protein